jgi:hypothetical protein
MLIISKDYFCGTVTQSIDEPGTEAAIPQTAGRII